MKSTRIQRRLMKKSARNQPESMSLVGREYWPANGDSSRVEVWINQHFLVQVFAEKESIRITVNHTTHNGESWDEGITWSELQSVKRQIGRGDCQAIEIYPPDSSVVNVANMRHLWILPEPIKVGW